MSGLNERVGDLLVVIGSNGTWLESAYRDVKAEGPPVRRLRHKELLVVLKTSSDTILEAGGSFYEWCTVATMDGVVGRVCVNSVSRLTSW